MRLRAISVRLSLALAAGLAAAASPASAQVFFRPFAHGFSYEYEAPRPSFPPPAPLIEEEEALSPREVARAARAQGFEPVGRPMRNGEVYVIEAQDGRGRRARLIVDAYDGAILRRFVNADGLVGERPLTRRRFAEPALDAQMPEARAPDAGAPRVIEGVGPKSSRKATEVETPKPRRAREAAAPRHEPRAAPARPVAPRPTGPTAGPAAAASPPAPPVAAAPAAPQRRPEPPKPIAPGPGAEAPGAIPPPPFMAPPQPEAAKPAAPDASKPVAQAPRAAAPATAAGPASTLPPVAPLDDAAPPVRSTPSVPPAPLD